MDRQRAARENVHDVAAVFSMVGDGVAPDNKRVEMIRRMTNFIHCRVQDKMTRTGFGRSLTLLRPSSYEGFEMATTCFSN